MSNYSFYDEIGFSSSLSLKFYFILVGGFQGQRVDTKGLGNEWDGDVRDTKNK